MKAMMRELNEMNPVDCTTEESVCRVVISLVFSSLLLVLLSLETTERCLSCLLTEDSRTGEEGRAINPKAPLSRICPS